MSDKMPKIPFSAKGHWMRKLLVFALVFLLVLEALPASPVSAAGVVSVCKSGCAYSTIQSAIDAASPGQIIEVNAGTYAEALTIPVNGTPSAWITLRAKAGDVVWIDGSNLGNLSNINLKNHSYWKISGLKMSFAAQGSPSGADGPADAITVGAGANNIILENLTIQAPNSDGIDLRGANYNIQVLDNEIFDMRKSNPNYSGDGHGIHVLQASNVAASHDILVKGNYVHDSHGKACLALSDFTALDSPHPTGVVFENNRVQDCTNGIKINADGIFRYNLIVDTGKYTSGVEKPDNCFQAFTHDAENNVRKAEIYNNTTVGCTNSYNFDMVYNNSTPNQTFTVFRNNIAYNPHSYFVRLSGTNLVSNGNNLFYKPGGGGSYIGYTPGSTSLVNVDPLFNSDYTLKDTSPAIDKGAVVDASLPYSGQAPDMGAFESIVSTEPTTFADVPSTYWAYPYIEAFYAEGITTGCGVNPAIFCPERSVTRAEMAVFILRSMNGQATPTPSESGMFSDVPVDGKEWMQPWIEEFFLDGLTVGCADIPLKYCPERQVTRAEMAVFLLKAIHGPSYQPPSATGIFSDVPVTGKEWMLPWIEQFYNEHITTGCAQNPLRFCPEQSVTRAEMSAFIVRAFGFPLLP